MFIDASECQRFDGEPRLFPDLAKQAFDYRLIALENAAGRLPVSIVSTLNNQGAPVLIDHDAGHAHRVMRGLPLCQDQVRHQGQPLLVELEG